MKICGGSGTGGGVPELQESHSDPAPGMGFGPIVRRN